jgi:predicted membrane protein DUF2306
MRSLECRHWRLRHSNFLIACGRVISECTEYLDMCTNERLCFGSVCRCRSTEDSQKFFPLITANCMQSFGWVVTTAIALSCIRTGDIIEHRYWMIRSYPFAMVFTAARTIHVFVPVARLGTTGGKAVLWICSALAAFLPNIFFDCQAIFPRTRRLSWPMNSRPS